MNGIGWSSIARLGLVQAALGAIVVLTTSTLNRVMVVELALPALVPGLLVALHHAVQLTRPRMGFGADRGGRSTPWIVGGMAVLAVGGIAAAVATAWCATARMPGLVLATVAFALIGIGVSASGTSLLVLLAKRVDPRRRAAAATLVWTMMIVGFAVTAGLAGRWLDPYTPQRLILVTTGVCTLAWLLAAVAVRGVEDGAALPTMSATATLPFRAAFAQVWSEPLARRFTVFVFLSMLAYSAQDLILEPFAGAAFAFTPGESTSLSGIQHGGVLLGMLLAAFAGSRPGFGSLRAWTVGGCLASAAALAALALAGVRGPDWPLRETVFALGVSNGAFSIAAIGSMMRLASQGREQREGVRLGLWGAAQAIAFGFGGLIGAAGSDIARRFIDAPGPAYGAVFGLEALLFIASAALAARIDAPGRAPSASRRTGGGSWRSTPTMPS